MLLPTRNRYGHLIDSLDKRISLFFPPADCTSHLSDGGRQAFLICPRKQASVIFYEVIVIMHDCVRWIDKYKVAVTSIVYRFLEIRSPERCCAQTLGNREQIAVNVPFAAPVRIVLGVSPICLAASSHDIQPSISVPCCSFTTLSSVVLPMFSCPFITVAPHCC
jgi:hypothetical protein